MKKIAAILLSMVIFLSLSTGVSSREFSNLKTADALTVLRVSAGLVELTEEQTVRLDLNLDGNITSADALAILRVAAGLPPFATGEYELCRYVDWYHGGGTGLILQDGFHELLMWYDLLVQADETIEEYLSTICRREYVFYCPCFLQTRGDILNFLFWLNLSELRLPFSDIAPLREIIIRDRYKDIYARYIIGDMVYNFMLYPIDSEGITVEEIIAGWVDSDSYKLLTTADDVNIYVRDFDEDPRGLFILSVNGAYAEVSISIDCANPDTCDRGVDYGSGHQCYGEQVDSQAALDGLMQFEFKTLLDSSTNLAHGRFSEVSGNVY
ncbi:MAG: hypothetical protein LBC86_02150 [Oscillospiraceae bacterium]|jgi:hypothetical protein|nr:hypothetical protein [Oscillospiraceae bacterium]